MPVRISKKNSIKTANKKSQVDVFGKRVQVYTKGGEFYYPDGTEYIGLFWSKGEKTYSGAGPDSKKISRIYKKPPSGAHPNYKELNVEAHTYEKMKRDYARKVPEIATTLPTVTSKDMDKGTISRYFVKNLNTGVITEISKAQHKALKGASKPMKTYIMLHELTWKISGPQDDLKTSSGIIQLPGIRDTNERTVNLSEKTFRGISDFIGPLLKYSKFNP